FEVIKSGSRNLEIISADIIVTCNSSPSCVLERVTAHGTPIRSDTATRHRVGRSPNLNAGHIDTFESVDRDRTAGSALADNASVIREVGRVDDPRGAGAVRVDGLLYPRRQRAL
ncbi:hypothetical protein ALC53_02019, partial [Atta colombica]